MKSEQTVRQENTETGVVHHKGGENTGNQNKQPTKHKNLEYTQGNPLYAHTATSVQKDCLQCPLM